MSSKRLSLVLIGLLVAAALAVAGGAYGINSLLVKQSKKLVDQKAKVASLKDQQTNLVQAKKDIKNYAELYEITKAVVPENKDQAEIVRQIVKIAARNSVSISTISFPASTLGESKAKVAPSGSAATTVAPKPLGGATATNGGKINLSQLEKVPNIPGVYLLQTDIQGDSNKPISYPQLINFLSDIEQNRLTAETTSIEITPSQGSLSTFSFKITVNSYIKP